MVKGEVEVVEFVFFVGRRGDVISRLPSGKVALVNRRAERVPQPKEKWLCRLDFEKERFAVVTPLQRIVKKEVPKYAEYSCGHRLPFDDGIREFVELPENEEPEPRITYFDRVCPECLKKHKDAELSEIDDFEVFKTLYFEQRDKIKEQLNRLHNKKIELRNSAILMIPEKNITGVRVIGPNYVDYMDCPYCCQNRIPIKDLKDGQRFKCNCGAEFTLVVSVRDKEGDGYIPEHIEDAYRYSLHLIDHKKEQEVEEDIKRLDEEIRELEKRLKELEQVYKEKEEQWIKEELKRHGIKEIKWDTDETGVGKVLVKFNDGNEIKGTVDELVWFDDEKYNELAELLMKIGRDVES